MKLSLLSLRHAPLLALLTTAFAAGISARGAVTLTVTPNTTSNTYSGNITLSISNLNSGETVVVQKFIDLNTNGIVDASDWLVQQYSLTDGQAGMVVAVITNLNVPGDSTPTNSTIISPQSFVTAGLPQQFVGKYLYKLSSPTGRFAATTNTFAVTNTAYAQSFIGAVKCSNTNVPNAGVLLFLPSAGEGLGKAVGGAIANNSGNYTIKAPAGTYALFAFKNGFLTDVSTLPVVTLNPSATSSNNLTLLPATRTITGKAVDALNTNLPLPGIMASWESTNNLISVGFTDTNGTFTSAVTPSQWHWGGDSSSLDLHGYLDFSDQGRPTVVVSANTNATIAFTKGTALFYGSVKDDQNRPLAGISLYGGSGSGSLEGDATTDQGGNYAMPIIAGSWYVQISSDEAPTNYVFSQPNSVALGDGQAVQLNFIGFRATNHISGFLKDNLNNPIGGVRIVDNATINGAFYETATDTDDTGYYALNVINGTWSVFISSGGGGLGSDYLVPPSQTIVISNNNATANFVAVLAPYRISGAVKDNSNTPIATISVYAYANINGTNYAFAVESDYSGNYSFGVVNGTWHVGVDCYDLSARGYQCVSEQIVPISNASGAANFVVQAIPPLQITTTSLPGGTVGESYDQWLDATGGTSGYTWSLSPGSPPLPAWLTLDPSGELYGLPDSSGTNSFSVRVTDSSSHTADQLLTLVISPGQTYVPDVLLYYLTKLEAFAQVDASSLVLNSNAGPFTAFLGIVQSAPGTVLLANVELPTGAFVGLPWGTDDVEIQNRQDFATQSAFDAAYPPGNYQFAIYGVDDGLQYPTLFLSPPVYPNPPHVSNFAAAQALGPQTPFMLQWDMIPGATTNDSLWVLITDVNGNPVFSTPYPATNPAAALPGTATSVIVPTNTFQLGHTYTGIITFFRTTSVNTTDYPGAVGATVTAVQTWFPLTGASGAPVLSQPVRLSSTQFRFQLSGIVGQNYTVQYSTTLTNWNTLLITNAPANAFLLLDSAATNAHRYYRAKVGP